MGPMLDIHSLCLMFMLFLSSLLWGKCFISYSDLGLSLKIFYLIFKKKGSQESKVKGCNISRWCRRPDLQCFQWPLTDPGHYLKAETRSFKSAAIQLMKDHCRWREWWWWCTQWVNDLFPKALRPISG